MTELNDDLKRKHKLSAKTRYYVNLLINIYNHKSRAFGTSQFSRRYLMLTIRLALQQTTKHRKSVKIADNHGQLLW